MLMQTLSNLATMTIAVLAVLSASAEATHFHCHGGSPDDMSWDFIFSLDEKNETVTNYMPDNSPQQTTHATISRATISWVTTYQGRAATCTVNHTLFRDTWVYHAK